MSFTFEGNRGTNTNKTTGTTVGVSPSQSISSGQLVVVTFVGDNMGTTQGATTAVTCADDQSNTYTRLFEYTQTGGSSSDGATVAVFYSILDTGIGTGDTVTCTHSNVVSRSIGLVEYSLSGTGVSVAGTNAAYGTGTGPSVTLGSLSSAAYLWIGAVGREGYGDSSYTQDSDYSDHTAHGTTGGGPASNTQHVGGYRTYTGTSDTYAPTVVTGDYVVALAAIEETGTGTNTSDSTGAYLKGKSTASSNTSAYLKGSTSASDNQGAYLRGGTEGSSSISAYMMCSTLDVSISFAYLFIPKSYGGGITGSTSAYTRGKDTTSSSTSALLHGSVDTSDSSNAYLKGKSTASDTQTAYLKGSIDASGDQTAYLKGSSTASDSTAAYLKGQNTASDTATAFLAGKDTANSSTEALLHGKDTATDTTSAYLVGGSSASDSTEAYTRGKNTASSSSEAYLRGQDTASDNQIALLSGIAGASDSTEAYLRGSDTASDNQEAYLRGSQDASNDITAYLLGALGASSSVEAYLKGLDTASDSTEAYLRGGINVSDTTPAFLYGQATASSSIPAHLVSGDEADSSTGAYLQGQDTATDSTEAYLKGSVNAVSSTEAYLFGEATVSDSISAFANGYGERLYPDGDISQSDNWQREDSSTSNLYVSIDEFPENDTDYVWYDDSPEGKYFEVSLTNPTGETVPAGDVHIVWRGYRKAGAQAITVKVELRQSTTVIASQSKLLTDTPMTFKYTLSSGEKSSITDWTNLRLRFVVEDVT